MNIIEIVALFVVSIAITTFFVKVIKEEKQHKKFSKVPVEAAASSIIHEQVFYNEHTNHLFIIKQHNPNTIYVRTKGQHIHHLGAL